MAKLSLFFFFFLLVCFLFFVFVFAVGFVSWFFWCGIDLIELSSYIRTEVFHMETLMVPNNHVIQYL